LLLFLGSDSRVPTIGFDLDIQNKIFKGSKGSTSQNRGIAKWVTATFSYTHLSADELQLTKLHTVTLFLSSCVAVFLLYNVGKAIFFSNRSTVHLALLWVALVAVFDALASLCEIVHLRIYHNNGIGSYAIDAMAAHCEAVCDALLIILLLSLAAGWTLPSDVVLPYNPATASPMQRLVGQFSSPIASLMERQGTGGGKMNIGSFFCLFLLATHVICAQWGRIYNDDFESYHDYAHVPGRIIMTIRCVTGLFVVIAALQTRLRCRVLALQQFYVRFAWLSTIWCQSLPALVTGCNVMVPYYLRRPTVVIGSALLQSSCIALMAWLVTSHTGTYQQFSHISSTSDASVNSKASRGGGGIGNGFDDSNSELPGTSLTESLQNATTQRGHHNKSGASSWNVYKSKVRLD
jgi:Rhodopsin-like GPCR transmembrane domain